MIKYKYLLPYSIIQFLYNLKLSTDKEMQMFSACNSSVKYKIKHFNRLEVLSFIVTS